MSDRVLRRSDFVGARVHDLATELTRARSDVDDPVGRANGVFVVLDDDERVAEVLELDQRLDEPPVVALVQADARLVEHVEHAGEARADLGREADALRFATAQRRGRASEVEVAEPDLDQELEPQPDLAQHRGGDVRLAVGQRERSHERVGVDEAELADIRDRVVVDRDCEHLGLEPLAVADRAGRLAQVARGSAASTTRTRPRGSCAGCRA